MKLQKGENSSPTILMIGFLDLAKSQGSSLHLMEIATEVGRFSRLVVLSVKGDNIYAPFINYKVSVIPIRFLRQLSWNILGLIVSIKLILKYKINIIYSRMDPGDFIGYFLSIIFKIPLIVELNGLPTIDVKLYRSSNKLLIFLSELWETKIYKRSSIIVGSSGYVDFVKRHFNNNANKFRVVPLGVNTSLFFPTRIVEAKQKLKLDSGTRYIVWIGSIAPWQGLETLIHAMKIVLHNLPNVNLLIVGNGSEFDKLLSLTKDLGLLNHVKFVGRVKYEDVSVFINAASCCVATFPGNRGDEGTISSLKSALYLACGRPIITTTMDDLSSEIIKNDYGKVVEPDDPIKLGTALIEILRLKDEEIEKRFAGSIEFIRNTRTWSHCSEKLIKIFAEVVCSGKI